MTESPSSLTSGRRLARSVLWNIAGLLAPLIVGLYAIPLLIDGMGEERFGLLTIIWMGVGYFSLFDMGLGRALTKLVAERLGSGEEQDMGYLIWTALWIILGFGILGGLILFGGAGSLIEYIFNVKKNLETEAVAAFRILAAGIPFVIVTAALRGLLEAHQRFRLISTIRIPLGALTFLGPLVTLQFSPSLVWATVAMLGGRIVATLVYYVAASLQRPELARPMLPKKTLVMPLFQFGGWLTVTNVVGPLMVYFDRFLLGTVLTMTAVTYYVTPYEVLSRLRMVPSAIMSVLFPALSTAQAQQERSRLVYLYERTTRVLLVLMIPVAGFFFLFAPEGLTLWLGPEFREKSTAVVRWLAAGWLINVMAHAPLTVLQTSGRPDLVAKTHLSELIPYGIILWFFTLHFGIEGTAAAWFIRVLADTLILNELARRKIPELGAVVGRTYVELAAVLSVTSGLLSVASLPGRFLSFLLVLAVVAFPAFRLIRNALLGQSFRDASSPN